MARWYDWQPQVENKHYSVTFCAFTSAFEVLYRDDGGCFSTSPDVLVPTEGNDIEPLELRDHSEQIEAEPDHQHLYTEPR